MLLHPRFVGGLQLIDSSGRKDRVAHFLALDNDGRAVCKQMCRLLCNPTIAMYQLYRELVMMRIGLRLEYENTRWQGRPFHTISISENIHSALDQTLGTEMTGTGQLRVDHYKTEFW